MRLLVTCEGCKHRQRVERPIRSPQTVRLVCHACEATLRVDVTAADIAEAAASAIRRRPR